MHPLLMKEIIEGARRRSALGDCAEDSPHSPEMLETLILDLVDARPKPAETDRELARIMFEAYNQSTGGLTYDGRQIPTWDQIADPLDFKNHNPRVIQAWTDAARAGREALELANARIAGENFRIGLEALEQTAPELATSARGMLAFPPVILRVEGPSTEADKAQLRRALEQLDSYRGEIQPLELDLEFHAGDPGKASAGLEALYGGSAGGGKTGYDKGICTLPDDDARARMIDVSDRLDSLADELEELEVCPEMLEIIGRLEGIVRGKLRKQGIGQAEPRGLGFPGDPYPWESAQALEEDAPRCPACATRPPVDEAERPQQGRPMEAPPEYADQWYARHKGYRCGITFARTREELEILIARDELPRICPETKCDRELEPRDIEIVQIGGARQVISYAELEESWKSRPAGWPPEAELEEEAPAFQWPGPELRRVCGDSHSPAECDEGCLERAEAAAGYIRTVDPGPCPDCGGARDGQIHAWERCHQAGGIIRQIHSDAERPHLLWVDWKIGEQPGRTLINLDSRMTGEGSYIPDSHYPGRFYEALEHVMSVAELQKHFDRREIFGWHAGGPIATCDCLICAPLAPCPGDCDARVQLEEGGDR